MRKRQTLINLERFYAPQAKVYIWKKIPRPKILQGIWPYRTFDQILVLKEE